MNIGRKFFKNINMENLKNELGRFLIVGIAVVAADAIIYSSLLFFLRPWLSKAIAFICGTTVAYLANKFWTFRKPEHSHQELMKFVFLYLITIIVNVGANTLVLSFNNSFFVAYIMATGVSASLNFIGQKFFIFNKNA